MNRIFTLLFVALGLLTPGATAQGAKAHAKLYTRVESGALQIALVIDIDRGYHLYHRELGASDSVGKPLVVTLDGEVASFEDLIWPEPHRYEQPGQGDNERDTFILGHEDELVLYGRAALAEGQADAKISAKLNGLTCLEGGSCYLYRETVSSKGSGNQKVWANYPADAWQAPKSEAAKAFDTSGFGFGAQDEGDGLRAHGKLYTRTEGKRFELAIVIAIDEGLHLYHKELGGKNATGKPLTLSFSGEGLKVGELTWPEPHRYVQEDFEDGGETYILGHETELVIHGTGTLSGGASTADLRVALSGLTCEASGSCYTYDETLKSSGPGEASLWARFETKASAVPAPLEPKGELGGGVDPLQKRKDKGLLALILAAIGGGIFALMMPCTYPMIPITISFFTKQAEARGGNILSLSLLYGAGIVLIFVVIGVVVGPVILKFATHPATNIVLGSMFVLFAAALFGAITLNPPAAMMNLAGKASMKGGLLGVFLMGMTLVLTSFTCTAPFVGSLLSIAASGGEDGGILRIALGMGVFGLTMAVPFTILALVPGKIQALPSSGEWMDTLKVSLGFIELAAALKFFSNADVVMDWGVLSREVFLLMWTLIFAIGGIYLMGWIRVKGHAADAISSGRMLGAMSFLLFGAYCWHGYTGHSMDNIMTAIIPPYSSAPVLPGGFVAVGSAGAPRTARSMVEDNHERAIALALDEAKPVLINFTGKS